MDYTQEDREIEEIFKRKEFENNKDINEATERYTNAKNRSTIRSEIRRESSKKRKIERRKRIITVLLAGSTLISLYTISKKVDIPNPITIVTEQLEESKRIDEIIYNYQKLMNIDADFAIESSNSRNKNYEPVVYYNEQNIDNLSTIITNAAKISEEEFRCAVLAAYKIINEPYREEILNEGFKLASQKEEETTFKIPSSIQEYFETLGYEDIREYNNNERQNIKKLEETEIKTGGKIL